MKTPSGTKSISDVLYVPKIDQNFISVGQLLEKDFSLVFKINLVQYIILMALKCCLLG